ncbi:TULIP family P47-like protein [uncultured Roseobacter sp.]|uniref:TULIP family P47-like protein n=1 Tax=uncultured Roseobacter sp. TaxID=114847 RepID=UPI0026322D66|nr:TULIP family P47-like protein [uncultured Roseobacter sp.]
MTVDTRNYEDVSKSPPPADWDGSQYHVRFPHLTTNVDAKPDIHAMMQATRAQSIKEADTYDWDTVFAVKFKDVNKAIAKPGNTPTEYDQSESTTDSNIKGTFGAWSLTGGGDTLLHMNVALTSGTLTYRGNESPPQQHVVDLAGVSATIEITLDQLPQPKPVANHKTKKTTTGGNTVGLRVSQEDTVDVTQVNNLPSNAGFEATLLVQGLLKLWFNANLDKFTYAFASVDLNAKADKGGYQWLQPKYVGYAVLQGPTVEDSVFGVLCMVDDAVTAPPTAQVSPNAIPEGQDSGFLISQKKFFQHLVQPGIYTMFDGAKKDDFEVSPDGSKITNKNTVTMNKVGDSDYQPVCAENTVQITLDGATTIKFELLKAVVDFSPGITIVMTYTMFSNIVLQTNSKGGQVLDYKKAQEPIIDHNVEVASWVTWTEVAASVLVAVATLGTGAAIKKMCERIALKIVALIITALVLELIANIGAIITAVAEGDKDKLPTIDLMAVNATNPITWTDSGDFLITSAGLAKSLQLGGNPNFITS